MKPKTQNPVPLFGYALLLIQVLVLGFHFLVIFGMIDFHHVWGGRLTNVTEMLVFEGISIGLNGLLLWIVLQRIGFSPQVLSYQVISVILWIFTGIFTLNSFGNLFAHSIWEQIFGTLFTVVAAILCYAGAKFPKPKP